MGIKQAHVVSVYVSDQDRALDFYTNALGFELRWDARYGEDYRWIEVVPPGAARAIALLKPYAGRLEICGPTMFVLPTADIIGTYAELHDRGVEFIEAPAMQPRGMMRAIFADVDGNQCVLVQPSSHCHASDSLKPIEALVQRLDSSRFDAGEAFKRYSRANSASSAATCLMPSTKSSSRICSSGA
jgi:lactoylglutathione lyase